MMMSDCNTLVLLLVTLTMGVQYAIGNEPQGCTPCSDKSYQCPNNCPSKYFPAETDPPCLSVNATTPTAEISTSSPATTNTTTDFSTPQNLTSTPAALVRCSPCYRHCQTCFGKANDQCLSCEPGYELFNITTNSTENPTAAGSSSNDNADHRTKDIPRECRPITKDDKGPPLGLIVGASVGGVVVVVLVVMGVVLCVRWRRRSGGRKEEEGGSAPGLGLNRDSASSVYRDPSSLGEEEPDVQKSSKSKRSQGGDPTYMNVSTKAPRPVSIQIGHDNVLRYTRDPTLNIKNKPDLNRSHSEEQELDELGNAPLPPGMQAETYEIQDFPPAASHPESHSPQSYEIVEAPFKPTKTKAKSSATTQRSHTTVAKKPANRGQRRGRTDKQAAAVTSLPYPAASQSCPENLFPMEQAARKKAPALHNVPEDELSDPEQDYQNAPAPKKSLLPRAPQPDLKQGVDNSAAAGLGEDDDDPSEIYANQDAINQEKEEEEAEVDYENALPRKEE